MKSILKKASYSIKLRKPSSIPTASIYCAINIKLYTFFYLVIAWFVKFNYVKLYCTEAIHIKVESSSTNSIMVMIVNHSSHYATGVLHFPVRVL